MPISDATREDAQRLVQRYPVSRSALLPLLHLVQAEEGYVSEEGVAFCAQLLDLTKAEVGAVATFYTMYKREPFGDYLLSVCTNPTCAIVGGQRIYESYVEACGGGHVDRDGSGVMVEHAECLGICDAAPVVQINYEMYGPVTEDEAMDLLAKAKAGDPPVSRWSGEAPPVFAEVQRQLSGIEDGTDEHLIEAARIQATESEVSPTYRSGETDIPVTHPGGDTAGHGGTAFRSSSKLGRPRRGPQEFTVSQNLPEEQRRIKKRLAESGIGVEAELAAAALGSSDGAPAAEETPAAGDQPVLADDGAAPEETQAGAPVGSEDEPGDSMAGEGGSEEIAQPASEGDVPSEEESDHSTPDGRPAHRSDADGAADEDAAGDDDGEEA